jgi:hypothetical protein
MLCDWHDESDPGLRFPYGLQAPTKNEIVMVNGQQVKTRIPVTDANPFRFDATAYVDHKINRDAAEFLRAVNSMAVLATLPISAELTGKASEDLKLWKHVWKDIAPNPKDKVDKKSGAVSARSSTAVRFKATLDNPSLRKADPSNPAAPQHDDSYLRLPFWLKSIVRDPTTGKIRLNVARCANYDILLDPTKTAPYNIKPIIECMRVMNASGPAVTAEMTQVLIVFGSGRTTVRTQALDTEAGMDIMVGESVPLPLPAPGTDAKKDADGNAQSPPPSTSTGSELTVI